MGRQCVRIVAGKDGCQLASTSGSVAIIVDAMRASTMLCTLLHVGVREAHVVRRVSEARKLIKKFSGALLVGERKGLKLKGFDFSNSPTEVLSKRPKGKIAIFTSTTGAQRLHEAIGARAIFVGSAVNASAVAKVATKVAKKNGCDIVIIPAGRSDNPMLPSDEDWYASALIASRAGLPICDEQRDLLSNMLDDIERYGLNRIFSESIHGQYLISIGLAEDVEFCSQVDLLTEVPYVRDVLHFDDGIRSVLVSKASLRLNLNRTKKEQ
jgi:2-phosphosulfolactate phosphatase